MSYEGVTKALLNAVSRRYEDLRNALVNLRDTKAFVGKFDESRPRLDSSRGRPGWVGSVAGELRVRKVVCALPRCPGE